LKIIELNEWENILIGVRNTKKDLKHPIFEIGYFKIWLGMSCIEKAVSG
jgi:hypothetical protein